jgi:GNAT superfamily N-acetyltransferase
MAEQAEQAEQWQRNGFRLTNDLSEIDVDAVYAFLHESYWAKGIPLEVVQRSLEHSLNFGLLQGERLVGFARVVTDFATFAYVGDVFVLPEFRGQGLATWMMSCVVSHPELQSLRRWCLATRDAHHVYQRVGFETTKIPERWMEMVNPHVYDVPVVVSPEE